MGKYISSLSLVRSTNNRDLLDSHKANVEWWNPRNTKAATCLDFLCGRQWTDEEYAAAKKKNKSLVAYNFLKPAERTIIGNFIDSEWDLKWVPVGGRGDDKLVAGLEALRIREAQQQQDKYLDSEIYSMAWATSLGYQEVAVDYAPGQKPRTRTENRNRFAVYPEATSKDVITRDDANFIDLKTFASVEDLCDAFPERKDWIIEMDRGRAEASRGNVNSFVQFNVSTDRTHETQNYRDGLYAVTERYFRVKRSHLSDEERGSSLSPITGRPYCPPGIPHTEELWYAVVVEGFGTSEYLFKGRYHFQPVNPSTGRIIWPILEMCFEAVNGEPQGGVEFDLDPARAFNALMSNLLHSAKHASSQSIFLDKGAFYSEKDFKDAAKYHADADRAFPVKDGRATTAAAPVPHAQSSQDLYSALEYAKKAQDELTAAPPALQGMREGNQSGVLHSQLMAQGEIQLAHSKANYERFLARKYLLRYIIWRQYYSEEMVVEIIEPTPEQRKQGVQSVTLNQMVPQVDQYGFPIPGEVDVLNDVDAYLFDLAIVPSTRSYTQRMKTISQLAEVSQSPALAADPGLASIILQIQTDLLDIDPKYKDQIEARREQMAQNEQAAQQVAQAETQAVMQKANSAEQSAQAQLIVANATAQSMATQGQNKQQEIAIKAGDSQAKRQDAMLKYQSEMRKAESEQDKIRMEAMFSQQEFQMDQQTKQSEMIQQEQTRVADMQMKEMEIRMKEMDMRMKQMEVRSKARESLENEFAPEGQD